MWATIQIRTEYYDNKYGLVLQKVDELSSLESLDYLIEQYGINCNGLTKNEIIDLILVNVLSLEEYRYYKHYVLYEEQKKNNLLIEAVGNIEKITKIK